MGRASNQIEVFRPKPAQDWPLDICQPIDLNKIIAPIIETLKATHDISEKSKKYSDRDEPIAWRGPAEVGASDRNFSYTKVSEILDRENLKEQKERDRDLLNVLVTMAVQMGIEQGRRIERGNLIENVSKFKGLTSLDRVELHEWLKRWSR
jgi:hypothetical protein